MPWSYGVLAGVAGLLARDARRRRRRSNTDPAVPLFLQMTFTPTNETLLGRCHGAPVPRQRSCGATCRASGRGRRPTPMGRRRHHPVARMAEWIAQSPVDTVDWYTPRRLVELDVGAADRLVPSRPDPSARPAGVAPAEPSRYRSTRSRPRPRPALGRRLARRLAHPSPAARLRPANDPCRPPRRSAGAEHLPANARAVRAPAQPLDNPPHPAPSRTCRQLPGSHRPSWSSARSRAG